MTKSYDLCRLSAAVSIVKYEVKICCGGERICAEFLLGKKLGKFLFKGQE
jgi:hypothetical protein